MKPFLLVCLMLVLSCEPSSFSNSELEVPKVEKAEARDCGRILEELVAKGRDSFHFPDQIPETLEESFMVLDDMINGDLKSWITCLEDGDFSTAVHFSIGISLRNQWGLWAGSELSIFFNEIGIAHPDDMSAIILNSYQRRLKKEDIKLQDQITKYQDYWKHQNDGGNDELSGPSSEDLQ